MKKTKVLIKSAISHLIHPKLYLLSKIGHRSYIGRQAYCKSPKLLRIGSDVRIGRNFYVSIFCNFLGKNYPASVTIGDRCYIGDNFKVLSGESITIGNDVLIASDVLITSENHGINPLDKKQYMHQDLKTLPVGIGDGVWIGEKVIILPGVKIGEKAIIGAGSIVTKAIPPYCIAVGNPAVVIKKFNFNKNEWEKCL